MPSFREQMFLLIVSKTSVVHADYYLKDAQRIADMCCREWGHDWVAKECRRCGRSIVSIRVVEAEVREREAEVREREREREVTNTTNATAIAAITQNTDTDTDARPAARPDLKIVQTAPRHKPRRFGGRG
jgi:hypothetical protein